MKAYTTL